MNAIGPVMWKLAVENDEGQQTSIALVQAEYSIGRAEGCAVRLDERNISRTHCTIRKVGDTWQLHDDHSYNGTYVNGQRVVESWPIGPGDLVQLGDYRLELLNEAAIQARSEEAGSKTSGWQRRPSRLVMVLGPSPGKEYAVEGERRTIGCAEACDIFIDHPSVSQLHCELLNMGSGRWEVIETDGSDGMRINGIPLRRGIIEHGDALELGDVRLKFVAEGKFFRSATAAGIAAGAVPFSQTAMAGDGTTTMVAEQRSTRRWLLVGGGLIVLVVLAAVGLLLMPSERGDDPDAEQPVAESESEARGVLEDALKYAEDDLDLAHKLLKRIPENSPVRDDEGFRDIEDRWAQALIAKALDTKDKDEATRLLNEVAYADTVSAERRYQAIDILKELGVTELPSLPVARPAKVPKTRRRAASRPRGEDIYEDSEAKSKEPSTSSAARPEDVYEDSASTPAPPREDVYEESASTPPPPEPQPAKPQPAAPAGDLYE